MAGQIAAGETAHRKTQGELTALNKELESAIARANEMAVSAEDARKIILSETGSHFDPAIIQAFLSAEKEILAIQRGTDAGKAVA